MSDVIDLYNKKVEGFPLTEELLFGDTENNIVRNIAFAIAKVPEQSNDIIADRLIITSKDSYIPKEMIQDMSVNNVSNKPFFKLYTFETNMTKMCFAYKSKDYNSERFKVTGESEKLYILFSKKNDNINGYEDNIQITDNKIFYERKIVNSPGQCPKNECPQCPKNECPQNECPQCTDTKPYFYALLVCGIIIFFMTLFFIYNFTKENKKIKENILEK
jgi:hypothetical protein